MLITKHLHSNNYSNLIQILQYFLNFIQDDISCIELQRESALNGGTSNDDKVVTFLVIGMNERGCKSMPIVKKNDETNLN